MENILEGLSKKTDTGPNSNGKLIDEDSSDATILSGFCDTQSC